ncbi:response regulator transcription factor [Nocardioides islandensis]|jgi:DNA-binding NarL/FixJ family response regulator|uniref:Response regulator transcription factor n=1 Tax=Nocardioides islandensis TaxID=433663 RepID=A0A930VDB3_9ACTN|nr:response regulator transcription factor [Nocardioides islandensis]MBF4764388.1 response regulator transcription factor [Nocardioides islandensis]
MIRVLLVDDQELVREGVRVILDAQPDIEVVGELGDATTIVETTRRARPDVVLMDVRMPRTNGIEGTRALRASGLSGVAVLVLTTFDLDEYVYEALLAGANGFLLKDAPRQRLLEAVRVLAAGEALLDPVVTRRLIESFIRGRPTPEPPVSLRRLSEREAEVLHALGRGLTNAEIGTALHITEATVKTHVANVLRKLGLRDRTHAVIFAYEAGVLRPGRSDGPLSR